MRLRQFLLIGLAVIAGCALPPTPERPMVVAAPALSRDEVRMADGYRLPLHVWLAGDAPRAVLIGLHGFNDYGQAFAPLAQDLAHAGVATYALDQRGFGGTARAGRWPGSQALVEDLHTLAALLRRRHPAARLYVAGESMGGAVAMVAAATRPLPVDGLILIAPAVWSRDTMPWYQRLALTTAVRTLPGMELTGKGIRLYPSDNLPMLRAMAADPLVIKATRVDALWGIANLMDQARAAAPSLRMPVLLLYGERDQIIPRTAFCRLTADLTEQAPALRLVLYRDGWHMLPRDLQGARVRADIAAWLADPTAALPSDEEVGLYRGRHAAFCPPGGGRQESRRIRPADAEAGWPPRQAKTVRRISSATSRSLEVPLSGRT